MSVDDGKIAAGTDAASHDMIQQGIQVADLKENGPTVLLFPLVKRAMRTMP